MKFFRIFAALPALSLFIFALGGCFSPIELSNQNSFPIDDHTLAKQTYFKNHIILGYDEKNSPAMLAALIGGRIVQDIASIKAAIVELPKDISVAQALGKLYSAHPTGLRYVEADYMRQLIEPARSRARKDSFIENQQEDSKETDMSDPLAKRQYALDLMHARAAWQKATGKDVVIAIVDTGIDGTHSDLTGKQVTGMSCLDGELIPADSDGSQDSNSHGSHVAGIAAASGKNNVGVIGVAYEAKIMSLRIFDARMESDTNGSGYVGDANVARCLAWAATIGPDGIEHSGDEAKVFNNSWSGKGYSQVLKDAIDIVIKAGGFFAAAMANTSEDEIRYPQAYPGVVPVGATNARDRKAEFSTMGKQISLSAPGELILSTIPQWLPQAGTNEPLMYDYFDGTSMATPQVAGAAALIKQLYPNATQYQIRRVLETSADDIEAGGFDTRTGWGRLNLERAVGVGALPSDGGSVSIKITSQNAADTNGDEQISSLDESVNLPAVDVILRQGNEDKYYTRTNGDGLANFTAIAPGTYAVIVGGGDATAYSYRVANRATTRGTVTVSSAKESMLKLTLNSVLKVTLEWTGVGDLDLKINEPHEDGRQRWVSAKHDDFEERWGKFTSLGEDALNSKQSETYTLNSVHYPFATYEIGISGQYLQETVNDVKVIIEQNGVRETYGPFSVKKGDFLPSYRWPGWWASNEDPARGVFFGPTGPLVF